MLRAGFARVWSFALRQRIRPLLREQEANERLVSAGPNDWLEWWQQHGERELRCILMTAWDPIGVGDMPEAWSE